MQTPAMQELIAKRNNAIKGIFSKFTTEALLTIFAEGDKIQPAKGFFDPDELEDHMQHMVEFMAALPEHVTKVLEVEMLEIDPGHTKTRGERFQEAMMAHIVGQLELVAKHAAEIEANKAKLDQASMMKKAEETGLLPPGMPKEVQDAWRELTVAKKRAHNAKAELDNLQATMGEKHPYAVEALDYYGKQVHAYGQELAKFKMVLEQIKK